MTHANTLFAHLVIAHHTHKKKQLIHKSDDLKRKMRVVRQKNAFQEHKRARHAQLRALRALQHDLMQAEQSLERLGEHEKARALQERLTQVRVKIEEKEKKLAST